MDPSNEFRGSRNVFLRSPQRVCRLCATLPGDNLEASGVFTTKFQSRFPGNATLGGSTTGFKVA